MIREFQVRRAFKQSSKKALNNRVPPVRISARRDVLPRHRFIRQFTNLKPQKFVWMLIDQMMPDARLLRGAGLACDPPCRGKLHRIDAEISAPILHATSIARRFP